MKARISEEVQMKIDCKKILTMFLGLIAASQVARASNCDGARTQTDLNQCAAQEFHLEAARLDDTYNSYLSRLTDDQQIRFAEAHATWRKFMDLSCDFESSAVLGGSAHQLVLASCLTSMTQERILSIQALLRCPEGALNCPQPRRK